MGVKIEVLLKSRIEAKKLKVRSKLQIFLIGGRIFFSDEDKTKNNQNFSQNHSVLSCMKATNSPSNLARSLQLI